MMTEQDLQEIEERANAATPGPWEFSIGEAWTVYRDNTYTEAIAILPSGADGNHARNNAMFTARARADVPALIAEVRSLRAKLDAVPDYVFWCFDEHERGRDVFPLLDEWLSKQEVQP